MGDYAPMEAGGFESMDWWRPLIDPKILEAEAAVNSVKESIRRQDLATKRENLIAAIGPVIQLRSRYFGRSTYYYNAEQNKIYEIQNDTATLRIPDFEVDRTLREVNGLPAPR